MPSKRELVMEPTLKKYFFAFIIVLVVVVQAFVLQLQARNLTFLSQSTIDNLLKSFHGAEAISSELKMQELNGKSWACELYGVRSRMQQDSQLNLYTFQKEDKMSLRNRGSQVIRQYGIVSGQLRGETTQLQETLKITAQGRLMGLMVMKDTRPESVVAISDCSLVTEHNKPE